MEKATLRRAPSSVKTSAGRQGKSPRLNIGILGFGKEGQSLLKFLQKRGLSRIPPGRWPRARGKTRTNADIWILDEDPKILVPRGVHRQLGKSYLKNLNSFDIIFRSPGFPYTLPAIQNAKKQGTIITSATKFFFEQFPRKIRGGGSRGKQNKWPKLIVVTGSKGKSTTSTLISKILNAAGKKTILAGNIGTPLLSILPQLQKAKYLVVELSSFQLQDANLKPDIAVVLDVFPEHLDKHKTLSEYVAAKASIGKSQDKRDAIFYFANNALSKKVAAKSRAKHFPIRPKESGVEKNKEMAAAVARFLKVPTSVIKKTIAKFPGLPHRLEFVRTITPHQEHTEKLEYLRIMFVNDSAATNPNATAAALASFSEPVVLIAGGRDKNLDYAPLTNAVRKSPHLQSVILCGENAAKVKSAIKKGGFDMKKVMRVKTLEEAVNHSYHIAGSLLAICHVPSAVVLYSPTATSFDMFENYADRGNQFKKLVHNLSQNFRA